MHSRYAILLIVAFYASKFPVAVTADACFVEPGKASTIRVEAREVVLPVYVVEVKETSKMVIDPYGKEEWVDMLHSQEITGLSATSFHIFEDGTEQKVQHFSIEKSHLWTAQDNLAQHAEYSCTPAGIWGGSDEQKIDYHAERYHAYLLTYVPPPSSKGSCHRITVKVDHKHATIYAPDQYCNTDNPLSDPLNGASLGNKALQFANSSKSGTLPLVVQVISFQHSSDAYRVNISVEIPASRLGREWEGSKLRTSIAILGLVYDKNSQLALRFSDIACVPAENIGYDGPILQSGGVGPPSPISEGLKYFEDLLIPVTYQTQVELRPGDCRLEFVITDGQKFGRTTTSFKLDDVVKYKLAISGIALCKRYRQASAGPRSPSQAPQYVPLVSNGTEFTPGGDTRFSKSDPFISYFEIYGMQVENSVAMHLQVKVADPKTGEIKLDSGSEPLKLSTPPENGTAAVVRNISVNTLPPGTYELEAQVSDSKGNKTAWSSASFMVK